MSKTQDQLGIGSVVETLVVPEALCSTAPPAGAIGRITERAGNCWIVAFPLPFVGANGTIQFLRDESEELQLSYALPDLKGVHEKRPCPTRLVVVRLDDQERVDGDRRYGYGVHDVTHYPDLPLLSMDMSGDEAASEDVAERKEEFSRWLWSSEGLIERFYARSKERAKHKALVLCQKNGWHVYAEE